MSPQNWFRTAASQAAAGAKAKAPENNGVKGEPRNGATGKKRGRKPKERPPVAATEASPGTPGSTPPQSPARSPAPTDAGGRSRP